MGWGWHGKVARCLPPVVGAGSGTRTRTWLMQHPMVRFRGVQGGRDGCWRWATETAEWRCHDVEGFKIHVLYISSLLFYFFLSIFFLFHFFSVFVFSILFYFLSFPYSFLVLILPFIFFFFGFIFIVLSCFYLFFFFLFTFFMFSSFLFYILFPFNLIFILI